MTDLHLWRLGPAHLAAVISQITHNPRSPEQYKKKLSGLAGLSMSRSRYRSVREAATESASGPFQECHNHAALEALELVIIPSIHFLKSFYY